MSQSLSKIGVQFIADMSDMVQKMNGMSAFTKNWAEKLATSMFSATPEQKQLKFISDFRQNEINTWNEREQRERDMAVLKQRLQEEYYQKERELAQKVAAAEIQLRDNLYNQEESRRVNSAAFQLAIQKRVNEEILARMIQAEHEAEQYEKDALARVAAERDNLYNIEQQKKRNAIAEAAAEEERIVKAAIDNAAQHWINSYNLQQKLKREAALKEQQDIENAITRQLNLAKLRTEAYRAVGVAPPSSPGGPVVPVGVDPYEQGRQERENRKREETDFHRQMEVLRNRSRTAEEEHQRRMLQYQELRRRNIITEAELIEATTLSQQMLTQQTMTGGFGGATGALTQLSFAAEDFLQVMSMGGGVNMALMSASNNLTMVARAAIPATSAFAGLAAVGIPLLLVGLGGLIRYLSQAKDESERLRYELDLIRNTTAEDFDLSMKSRQREFAITLREASSSSQMNREMERAKLRQIELEEELAVKRTNANREVGAQVQSVREASNAIKYHYDVRRGYAENDAKTLQEITQREQQALQEYTAAHAKLMSTQIDNAEEAQVALQRFLVETANIPGLDTTNIESILADLEGGTLGAYEAIRQALEEISNLEAEREQAQKRLNELLQQERENRAGELRVEQQMLEAKREQILAEMKMTEEQRKMNDLRRRQLEFIGYDPAALGVGIQGAVGLTYGMGLAMQPHGLGMETGLAAAALQLIADNQQQQADKLGIEFLLAEQAKLQKEMVDAVQQPPVAAKMEQNAFQAQADALKQIAEAQNRKQDTRQEAMVRHLADISRAVQNGGIIAQVVP